MIISTFAGVLLSWLQIPGGTWEVEEATIADMKSRLESALWEETHSPEADVPAWASYTFQFQGRTVNGKKLIYINAFCSTPPKPAAIEWVQVFDGGKCYFDTYYDPEEKLVLSIRFNGVA